MADRANLIAETQRSYAFRQLVLGGFGVAFTALAAVAAIAAAVYAKHAAKAARDSADADNAALEETRAASVEARKDAAAQSKRLSEQLALAEQTMEFTAKTAHAMSDSAKETRRVAAAMRSSAEAAIKAADAAESHARAAEAADRAYVFFADTRQLSPEQPFSYRIIWRNFGKTPAIVTGLRAGVVCADQPPLPSTMSSYELPVGAIIGAGDIWRRGGVSVVHLLEEYTVSATPIWLCAEISYRTIHGREHRSWLCRIFTGNQFLLDADVGPEFNGYT